MRFNCAAIALMSALTLSACGAGYGVSNHDNKHEFYPNCDEQAAMAQNGRTDGRAIIITCPKPGQPG